MAIWPLIFASIAQRGEHWTQMDEVLSSILIGVTCCWWIFLFSRGKASGANIAIIANIVCLWKTLVQMNHTADGEFHGNKSDISTKISGSISANTLLRPTAKGCKLRYHYVFVRITFQRWVIQFNQSAALCFKLFLLFAKQLSRSFSLV